MSDILRKIQFLGRGMRAAAAVVIKDVDNFGRDLKPNDAEYKAETKRKGVDTINFLNTLGIDTPVNLTTAEAAARGELKCPECQASDIDPMCANLFCRGCYHLWKP